MKKKTVLYINNDYRHFCGASLSLVDLLQSLKNQVIPIILLEEDGTVNKKFKELGYETIICPFFKLYAPSIISSYIYHLPSLLWHYYQIDKQCVNFVSNSLKERNIDLIHSNSSIFTVGYFLSKKMKVPHVWHIREFLDLDIHILLGKNRLRRLMNKSNSVICISRALKDYWMPNSKNSVVIGDAVRRCSDAIYIEKKEKFFLSCSAQLSDYKGSDFIVRAFCRSKVYLKGYNLFMIGEYTMSYKEKILNILKEENMPQGCVQLVGYRSEVKDYFSKATAFVMASRNEGLGRVSIEAMFYGCPVITKLVGGAEDFIQDKCTGLVYNSLEECSEQMSFVTENDMEAIIRSAQSFVMENYSIDNYGRKVWKVYESVTNR